MSNGGFTLEKLLNQAAHRMRTDLKERLISHGGELGTSREEIVRDFLRSYLPTKFDISTGFAFDSTGALSQQLDIVIADGLSCPRFENAGKKRFFPCESIVAVGQVKSRLGSAKEFHSALENLASAKCLDRSAGGLAIDKKTGEPLEPKTNHLHQIFTFLFVIGRSLGGGSIRDELLRFLEKHDCSVWPNVIVALDKHLVTFCCDQGICPNPLDARGIAIQNNSKDLDILMRFYLLLGQAIEVTRVSNMPYWAYLSKLRTWDAEVWYSLRDNPPPYLSSFMPI
jgi:hypothetical protein